ncbi:DUF3939 domain-containing protein [Alkalicoccus daliensis]|uniref:DUF3939 domain-containing protein n=1 Tax=Alkalicoccus daliensis TaxID=745820 RepID=A0A1H0DMN7_9BACI|nr:DUF3939 domain-containing protein [Alkalicoccus daliensis]SDN71306.1 Protein of unknown function [Alkalicoccus daliensis]
MFGRKRKGNPEKDQENKEPDIIECSIDDVRGAVSLFMKDADDRLSLRAIINADNKIDFSFLHDYLGGVPDRPFYMSKETFDIFADPDFARHIDRAQIACDQYFLEKGEHPVAPGDSSGKINYFKLKNYLKEEPPFDLFLHPEDRMVTHRKPAEK